MGVRIELAKPIHAETITSMIQKWVGPEATDLEYTEMEIGEGRMFIAADRHTSLSLKLPLREVVGAASVVEIDGRGYLENSVLVPWMRGRGIGKRLVQARLKWCVARGLTEVWTNAWESGEDHVSRHALASCGFKSIGVIEGLWDNESCIKCGESCSCDATHMIWYANP